MLVMGCSLMPKQQTTEETRKELDKALNNVDVPTMEGTMNTAGTEALNAGDSLKAEYYFEQLVKKYPNNASYKLKYAEALRRRGACKEALTLYEDALTKNPSEIDAREGKALCLVTLGEFQKAGPILTDIINSDSTRWKSINAAGLIFAINNKLAEANQYLALAADVSNQNPTVLNNQGLVRALTGNVDDAIRILKQASIRAGESTAQKRSIDLNLAMVYGISKNLDMAEATAKPWLTTPQLYNNMGIYAELGKDQDLARTYLNKALMGTAVYYDRAWENLERLDSGAGGGKRISAPQITEEPATPKKR